MEEKYSSMSMGRAFDGGSVQSLIELGLSPAISFFSCLEEIGVREIGKTYYGKEVRPDDKEMECAC